MSNNRAPSSSTTDAATGSSRSRAWGYLLAGIAMAAAFSLRLALDSLWGDHLAYALFFIVVVGLTFCTSLGPQLFAAFGGLILADWFFLSPRHSIFVQETEGLVNTAIYVGLCGVILGLSRRARRAAERELAARDRVTGILQCTKDAVCTVDAHWRITYFNRHASELSQRNPNDVLGRDLYETWPELAGTRFEAEYRSVMTRKQAVHFEEYDQLHQRWIEVHAAPYGDGIVIFFRDVNSRKRAEASKAQLAAIVESSDDAIFGYSSSGTIATWNRGAERLYGFTAAEAIGQQVSTLFASPSVPELANALERARKGETVSRLETKQPTKSGTLVDVSITLSPVQKVDSQNVSIAAVARDISDRKKAEAEREELIRKLQDALAEVKTLSGLLPICASCKRIRDEGGTWNQIELYIRDRSNASFSHGICPDCARRLYPSLG